MKRYKQLPFGNHSINSYTLAARIASVSVWIQNKERPKNGIEVLVPCSLLQNCTEMLAI